MVSGTEIGALGPGQYFGEMALLDDDVRKASVIAKTAVDCFVLDRTAFTKIMGSLQQIMNRETTLRKEAIKSASGGDDEQLHLKFTDLVTLAVLGLYFIYLFIYY